MINALLSAKRTLLFLICMVPAYSQSQATSVIGYRGSIEVTRSASGLETRVSLKSDTTLPGGSSQAVFALQHSADSSTPGNLNTRGRLLVSDGILAIVGDEGTRWLFKFPERLTPPSLKDTPFAIIPVYGIARYTEKAPSVSEKVPMMRQGNTVIQQAFGISPNEVEACPAHCDSGGEGSTSCTLISGGFSCSTTCAGGFHACCYYSAPNNPRCACCKD